MVAFNFLSKFSLQIARQPLGSGNKYSANPQICGCPLIFFLGVSQNIGFHNNRDVNTEIIVCI